MSGDGAPDLMAALRSSSERARVAREAPVAGLRATESAERGEVDPAVELVARSHYWRGRFDALQPEGTPNA